MLYIPSKSTVVGQLAKGGACIAKKGYSFSSLLMICSAKMALGNSQLKQNIREADKISNEEMDRKMRRSKP